MTENGSKNKPTWITIALCIAIALLIILDVILLCLSPQNEILTRPIILMSVVVLVILLLMNRKHIFVKEETRFTSHGFFFSRFIVPLLYAIAGITVFIIALWQLQAQNVATRDLLDKQQLDIQTQLKTQDDATKKLLVKQQNAIETLLGNQHKSTENLITAHKDLIKHLAEQLEVQTKIAKSQVEAEQFNNAIINLGSESRAVVHGGVHALNHLAMKNDEYTKQVFDILCSFLREETQPPEYKIRILERVDGTPENLARKARSDNNKPEPPKNGTSLDVIQTIVNILFLDENSRNCYKGFNVNLYEAFLQEVKFRNAKVNWAEADLKFVDLQEVKFVNADMQKAKLWQANLKGTILEYTNLEEADLWEANLQAAILTDVNLREVDLTDANLQGSFLALVDLKDANLTRANLQGVVFWNTIIQRTELNNADFRGVQSGDDSAFPSDFDPREALKTAVKTGTGLKTDLSGIILYDDDGNRLDLTEEGKKEWLRNRGAKVDDLSKEEVKELYNNNLKEFILRLHPDFEKNEDFPQPEDAPVESQDSDDP